MFGGLLVIASRRKNIEKTVLWEGKLFHLTAICRHCLKTNLLLWARNRGCAEKMRRTFFRSEVFTLVHSWCPDTILSWAPMWTHLFQSTQRQNSGSVTGSVPVPESLYSGTKLSTGSLCESCYTFCVGSLALYPQFRNSERVFDFFNMNIFQIGYCVSEHSTILWRYPGTSVRAPSVNTAWFWRVSRSICLQAWVKIIMQNNVLKTQKSFCNRLSRNYKQEFPKKVRGRGNKTHKTTLNLRWDSP